VHVCAARFPGFPLSFRFDHVRTHVKSYGWVVRGRPCQLVWAGLSRASVQTCSGEGIHINSYGLLWCGSLARLGPPLMPIQMIQVTGFLFT